MERFDGVGAGEDEPVEAVVALRGREAGERGVERGEAAGVDDFDGGDKDGFDTKRAQAVGEGRSLVGGARDENAFVQLQCPKQDRTVDWDKEAESACCGD